MSQVPTTNIPNTFSVLSPYTPIRTPVSISTPLGTSPYSSASLTGLVSPNSLITPSSIPVTVPQTVNSVNAVNFVPNINPINNPINSITKTTQVVTNIPPTVSISNLPQQTVSQPTTTNARNALASLNSTDGSVVIPVSNQNINIGQGGSQLYPSVRVVTPTSNLPSKPSAEIMNKDFEIRNYQGIISNSSIEKELLNASYAPLSKIVVRSDNGEKRTQYIKAMNKNGQTVFILIDTNGYTTARANDLTLIEAHSASVVPYSLKTGAYNCAGKDVCGVAFECGSDAVCVLSRGSDDLNPKEANFVYVEQNAPSAATIETEGTIMTYPVIRLSEIKANPNLVLTNTDIVTRRLRNSTYTAELQELATLQQSINKLSASFVRFNNMREDSAGKLNRTLTQLEQWNNIYNSNPPVTDGEKDKYRKLQYNLAQRNESISTLLRAMKKVASKHIEIDAIAKEINDITDHCEKEFRNIEYAVSD